MLIYKDLVELRQKLTNGEITQELAKEIYWNDHKEGERSWHTKDWKERRSEFIKDKCEICSSKDTLTIQHLSHPKKYSEYLSDVTRAYAKLYRDANPVVDIDDFTAYVLKKYDYVGVPFCPNCNWSKPSERVRKIPKYRCLGCRHEFDKPIYKSIDELISIFYENKDALEVRDKCFRSKEWKSWNNLSQIKYWLQREKAKTIDIEAIEKEAFLLFLDDNIKYLSFSDTITACRRCAYCYDMRNLELCPTCNLYYKGIQYQTCVQCLPENKRKVALEMIEFGKEWRAMHKDLGVD